MPPKKTAKHEIIEATPQAQSYTPAPYSDSAEKLMVQAIDKQVPVETMEKLMAMRRELKAEWAKEEYNKAMAAFQAECPVIEKKKQAKDGTKVLYKYAPLDDMVAQTQKLIAKHGFSYTFRQQNDGSKVKVSCIVSHVSGHSEESVMETGLATKTGIMSGPQQIAATVTFNTRYAFKNAFGIMTGDEDVDAAKAVVEPEQKPKPTPKTVEKAPEPIKGATLVQIRNMVEVQKITEDKLKDGLVKTTSKSTLEALTEEEGLKVLKMLKTKLEGDMKATKAEVEKAMPGPSTDTVQKRAMECASQEEATKIMQDMRAAGASEIKQTAITNILKTKGFTV